MKKIDFDNIAVDPINKVYTHIEKNVSQIIDNFFKEEFEETRPNNNIIVECDIKINENKKEFQKRKLEDSIDKRESTNLLIFILFFVLIGFLFWKKYKKNEKIINDFIKFKVSKIKENKEILRTKNIAIFSSFSTITLRDIYYYVFEKLGIQTAINIESKKIIDLINDKEILDVHSGIVGIFKNSPFYDVVVRKLYYTDVVWHYGVGESKKTIVVSTPFIEKKNLLIFKTNFLKELTLSSNSYLHNQDLLLENKDFINKYKISDYTNDSQKLSQFFTIKSQNDFVKWSNKEHSKVFAFVKKNDLFVVKNHTYFLSTLEEINKTLESLVTVKDIQNLNLESIKKVLKRKAIGYFLKFAKMIQLPLMIPGISREWYRKTGEYLIGQTSEFEIERIDTEEKIDILDILNKFLDRKYFWFNSKFKPVKPIWLTLDSSKVINNCKVAFVKINSFYGVVSTENLWNYSKMEETEEMELSYSSYVKFDEKKIIIHYAKYKKTSTQYIVTKQVNLLIFQNHYVDINLFEKIKNLSFWTNDPNRFENLSNKDELLKMASIFNEIDDKYNLQGSLKIDEYGLYITINNIANINDELLNQITKMLKSFSNIDY